MIRSTLLLACSLATSASPAPPPHDPVALLTGYLQIDTSNPPGNEKAGALYLKAVLDAAGITSELDEPAPGRASLYARLRGSGTAPALVLHHHIDVVPAAPTGWQSPPFAAAREGPRITARGALDDKALGIAQLLAFVSLARSPRTRDVILLATADEETGGALGLASAAQRHPEWLHGAGFAIGEGGETETVVDRQRFFGIEVAQKSALWLRLAAKGTAGHSASPDPKNPTSRLARLLGTLASWKRPIVVSPLVAGSLATLARVKPPELSRLFTSIGSRAASDPEALRRELSPRVLGIVTDTVAITRLGPSGGPPNAVPAEAFAALDCRLLPETDPKVFIDEVKRFAAPEDVAVEVTLDARAGPPSPADGALYETIAAVLGKRWAGTLVAPILGPGTSENRVLRARGIATYGLLPFRVNVYDLSGIHAANERIRADWFVEGVEAMKEIVAAFSTSPKAQP